MRRVAQALGVATMTLYTYVPGKAELIDLLLDAAYLQMRRQDTADQLWRQRLTAVANENRALYAAHPWAAEISTLRPPLGPGLMAKYEHELTALEGLGLTDMEMDDTLTHLLSFVQANARDVDNAARRGAARQRDERRAVVGVQRGPARPRPGRARLPPRDPCRHRSGSAPSSANDPDHAYCFGLQRLGWLRRRGAKRRRVWRRGQVVRGPARRRCRPARARPGRRRRRAGG